MRPLDAATLRTPPPGLAVPGYDRRAVEVGVVHFGVGAFHRAHEAMYLDRVIEAGDLSWGVCGVGVLPGDTAVRDALTGQNGLYTLLTVEPDGTEHARVVGSLVEVLHAPDDPDAVLARLVAPGTRIVSLTITEGGYGIDDHTGAFAPHDELTLADLADPAGPPRSVLGYLNRALRARRDRGLAPFTVLSCDNIHHNGTVARSAVLAFAQRTDPALASWIADTVAFPNSMVDRITPATTDEVRARVAAGYGIEDAWPVRAEAFEQWVVEDRFPSGRPALDSVGVQLVGDVEPFELMKLRLLNASHQVLGHLGLLCGLTYVHQACRDPGLRAFLRAYLDEEARPTLPAVPGIDLTAYCDTLLARFGSDTIRDTLARQTVDASDRIPKFLLPVVRARLAAGAPADRCAQVVAAWSLSVDGVAESATPLAPTDRRADALRGAAAAERTQPGAFLRALPSVFGDLATDPTFTAAFVHARTQLSRHGVAATLRDVDPAKR
jgi:mannitol 2-dehydrogenase